VSVSSTHGPAAPGSRRTFTFMRSTSTTSKSAGLEKTSRKKVRGLIVGSGVVGAELPGQRRLGLGVEGGMRMASQAWKRFELDWRGRDDRGAGEVPIGAAVSGGKAIPVLLVVVRDPREPPARRLLRHHRAPRQTGRGWPLPTTPRAGRSRSSSRCQAVPRCGSPQSWRHHGPERAAALSLWLTSAIWVWYIPTFGGHDDLAPPCLDPAKTTPVVPRRLGCTSPCAVAGPNCSGVVSSDHGRVVAGRHYLLAPLVIR
jgi:hypothetical protein